jgi:hypothetical protein
MRKLQTKWLAMLAMSAVLIGAMQVQTQAQPRGGGMRNNPKMRLGRLVMGIGILERNKTNALTASQAKKVVAAISPWRSKASMSEEQAKGVYIKVNSVLSTKQKNELDKEAAKNRRHDGAGDRPGGWGGGNGQRPSEEQIKEMRKRMEKMKGFFKTYNPFYPPTKYKQFNELPDRMQSGYKRRFAAQSALISQLAKKAAKA